MKHRTLLPVALLILVTAGAVYLVLEGARARQRAFQVESDVAPAPAPQAPERAATDNGYPSLPLPDQTRPHSPGQMSEKGAGSRSPGSRVTTDGTQTSTHPQPAVEENGQEETSASVSARVLVYYFHGTTRCATCRKLEAFSSEAVRQAFSEELQKGQLKWQILNIDEPENEHFVEDYQLYTRSLVVARVSGGKGTEWKNLERIWELVGDKAAFMKYVQDEIRAYLGAES